MEGLLDSAAWSLATGLGLSLQGGLMLAVGGLPRRWRRGATPELTPDTPEAFLADWIDQYNYLGAALVATGLTLVVAASVERLAGA